MPRVPCRNRLAFRVCVALVTIGAAAGCVSRPAGPPATARSLPGGLSTPLTVYPTPQRAEYGRFLLPLAGHRRVDVASSDFLDVLEDLELLATWKALPPEGYILEIGWRRGRTHIVLAAADEAGARWAREALTQLTTIAADGAALVRDCLIVDAPGFPLRGSKRPEAWEEAYRANFAWGARETDGFARREVLPFFAPGSPLDATAKGVRSALRTFGPWQVAGARRFALKFDDVGFALTPRTELAFGSYARAVVVYVATVRRALQSVDPGARLYYLPQTYWWRDDRFEPFSAALRASGGLPADVGLVLTGPEVVSAEIDAHELDAACGAFGTTSTRPLIYDNLGREGDWGPLTGRDAALVAVADAVFGERGTPVNRLTRLDWAWNPRGYDAERSWRRAISELAGPRGAATLRAACEAFRRGAPRDDVARAIDAFEAAPLGDFAGPLRRSELVRLLR